MKKITITLVLSFVFSVIAFASDKIVKEKKFPINEKASVNLKHQNLLKPPSPCFSIDVWFVQCPDGDLAVVAVDLYVVDCTSGDPIEGETIYSESPNDACGL